jgi:hypothetical protein
LQKQHNLWSKAEFSKKNFAESHQVSNKCKKWKRERWMKLTLAKFNQNSERIKLFLDLEILFDICTVFGEEQNDYKKIVLCET